MGIHIDTLLHAIDKHGAKAYEMLVSEGHEPNVVHAKMMRAADRGYTEYGGSELHHWLTQKGEEKISVYLVTCGSYSDYHIEAAFQTEAKAEEYIASQRQSWDMGIERHTTRDDETFVPMVEIRYRGADCLPRRKTFGREPLHEAYTLRSWTEKEPADTAWALQLEKGYLEGLDGIMASFRVSGTDTERVDKVASDTLAELKANEIYLTAFLESEGMEDWQLTAGGRAIER